MINIIEAPQLTQDIVDNLSDNLTPDGYPQKNRLAKTHDLRHNEPCERSILRKSVGDKLALFLLGHTKYILVATIEKVNKTTVTISYQRPHYTKTETLTVNEAGEIRGDKNAITRSRVYGYTEGDLEQAIEVQNYYNSVAQRTDQVRQDLSYELKQLAAKLDQMSLDQLEHKLQAVKGSYIETSRYHV